MIRLSHTYSKTHTLRFTHIYIQTRTLRTEHNNPPTHIHMYLELLLKSSDVLARHNLVHAVHLGPQVGGQNIRLPAGDELIQGIMDKHILDLKYT